MLKMFKIQSLWKIKETYWPKSYSTSTSRQERKMDYYNEFGVPMNATEDQIRSAVGAPSIEEEGTCLCGKLIDDCDEAYEHMTSGV